MAKAPRQVTVLAAAAPRLIGVHEREPRALLFSALPGSIASEGGLPAAAEYQVHVRAARLLRQLHAIPVGDAE